MLVDIKSSMSIHEQRIAALREMADKRRQHASQARQRNRSIRVGSYQLTLARVRPSIAHNI